MGIIEDYIAQRHRQREGRIIGRGRVVHRDGDVALLEASLSDSGATIATATATARVIPLARAKDAV